MRYKSILLFGAPGSGKGTQGKILGSIPGFYHSACGDVFRSLDLQSEMGRVFWEYSSRGELVPDEFTVKLWRSFIKGMELVNQFHPETELLVLDGIPRNKKQAELLDDTLDGLHPAHHRLAPRRSALTVSMCVFFQSSRAPTRSASQGTTLHNDCFKGSSPASRTCGSVPLGIT